MKKPKSTLITLAFVICGLFLFISGIIEKDWINLVAGMFMMMNGEITIINYNGRETD